MRWMLWVGMMVGCHPVWDGGYVVTDVGEDPCGLGLRPGDDVSVSRTGPGTFLLKFGPRDHDCELDDEDAFVLHAGPPVRADRAGPLRDRHHRPDVGARTLRSNSS